MYEEFKHPDNNGLYIYVEGPIELLYIEVPEESNNSKTDIEYDENSNIISYRLKKVYEYLTLPPYISTDKTKCIILLNELYDSRYYPVSESNILFWDNQLSIYGLGYSTGKWMGLDGSDVTNKLSDRLNSEDYEINNDT